MDVCVTHESTKFYNIYLSWLSIEIIDLLVLGPWSHLKTRLRVGDMLEYSRQARMPADRHIISHSQGLRSMVL